MPVARRLWRRVRTHLVYVRGRRRLVGALALQPAGEKVAVLPRQHLPNLSTADVPKY